VLEVCLYSAAKCIKIYCNLAKLWAVGFFLQHNVGSFHFTLKYFLDPECGSQNATLAVLVVVGISSLVSRNL